MIGQSDVVQTQVRSHLHGFLSHVNPECPLCNNQSETINQLFFKCSFATSILRCTSILHVTLQRDFDGITWLSTLSSKAIGDDLNTLTKALLICWEICDSRNKYVFQNVPFHPTKALNVAGQIGMD